MGDSSEKIAVVTGAGTGVGRSATLALLDMGYAVVLAGRRREPLEKTVSMAAGRSADTLVVPTDVARPKSVRNLFDQVRKAYGRLDLLFNNAGIAAPGVPLEDLRLEDWQAVVDVNLTGPFLCTREAFRIMKNQSPRGGRIINNGSISAHVPRPDSAPYTATKHAMTGLTRSTSLDGRRHDISCGQIDIGNAATDMTESMGQGVPQADGRIEMEPTMNVEDVGRAIRYMAGLPRNTNVLFMTIMANRMPYVGRG